MWKKVSESDLDRLLESEAARYSRVDLSYIGMSSFWAGVLAISTTVGLASVTGIPEIFGVAPVLNVLSLFASIFLVSESFLIGAVWFDRFLFDRKDQESKKTFIRQRKIGQAIKICTSCQKSYAAHAVSCPDCGGSLVSSIDYRWLEDDEHRIGDQGSDRR